MMLKSFRFFRISLCLALVGCVFPLFAASSSVPFLAMARKAILHYSEVETRQAIQEYLRLPEAVKQQKEIEFVYAYLLSKQCIPNAHHIPLVNPNEVLGISAILEHVLQQDLFYTDQVLPMNAQQKLASLWGSLSYYYLTKNTYDSACWALAEGRKRLAFSTFELDWNRILLRHCPPNTMLLVEGDHLFFELYYLQMSEHYRKDVTLIHIDWLTTFWYPCHLASLTERPDWFPSTPGKHYHHRLCDSVIYEPWSSQMVSVEHVARSAASPVVSWNIPPTHLDKYLLRSDVLLKRLIEKHRFASPVMYLEGMSPQQLIGMDKHAQNALLCSYIFPPEDFHPPVVIAPFLKDIIDCVSSYSHSEEVNLQLLMTRVHHVRKIVLREMAALLIATSSEDAIKDAAYLYHLLVRGFPTNLFPFESEEIQQLMTQLGFSFLAFQKE
jgi:hypothetical protein